MLNLAKYAILLLIAAVNYFLLKCFLVFIFQNFRDCKPLVVFFGAYPIFADPTKNAAIICTTAVFLLLFIAVKTKLGEKIVLLTMGYRKPHPTEREILKKAIENIRCDVDLTKVNVYSQVNGGINAAAVGTRNIVLTNFLYYRPAAQLRGVFLHEVGHLRNGDSELMLYCLVANLVISFLVNILVMLNKLFLVFCKIPLIGLVAVAFTWATAGLIMLINNCYTHPTNLLIYLSSQASEYRADKYAAEHGEARGLYDFLETIYNRRDNPGFFERILDLHPQTSKRMAKLEKYINPE